MPWVRCVECNRLWEAWEDQVDEPCYRCRGLHDDFDADELGLDPEEEYDA